MASRQKNRVSATLRWLYIALPTKPKATRANVPRVPNTISSQMTIIHRISRIAATIAHTSAFRGRRPGLAGLCAQPRSPSLGALDQRLVAAVGLERRAAAAGDIPADRVAVCGLSHVLRFLLRNS